MIIGSKLEPGFGPVIMLGMGGIYVEVLKDVTFKIAPVTSKEADDMISEIKTQKLLQGVRGEKPSDIAKLSECIHLVGPRNGDSMYFWPVCMHQLPTCQNLNCLLMLKIF